MGSMRWGQWATPMGEVPQERERQTEMGTWGMLCNRAVAGMQVLVSYHQQSPSQWSVLAVGSSPKQATISEQLLRSDSLHSPSQSSVGIAVGPCPSVKGAWIGTEGRWFFETAIFLVC